MRVKDIARAEYHDQPNTLTRSHYAANQAEILKLCIKPAITLLDNQKGARNENRGNWNRLCRAGIGCLFF
jgi:hypothetical protein